MDRSLRQLTTRLWVPQPLHEVFEFFADAHNLNELTPPWLRFEILNPAQIEMRVGALIDCRIRVRGLPMRWQSEITAWDPPHRFIDEQRRGPYRVWRHEHSLEEVDGGTAIVDIVDYLPRGGMLEPLIHRWFVRRDLERIFSHRVESLASRYGVAATVAEVD